MSHNDVLCKSGTRYEPLFTIAHTIATAIVNALFLIVIAYSVTEYIIVIAGDFAPESRANWVKKTRVIISAIFMYIQYTVFFSRKKNSCDA